MGEQKKVEFVVDAKDAGLSEPEAKQLEEDLQPAFVLALPERMKGGQVDVSIHVR